jgi:hypothetical protein
MRLVFSSIWQVFLVLVISACEATFIPANTASETAVITTGNELPEKKVLTGDQSVERKAIKVANEKPLELPNPPRASYRGYTNTKGIWLRAESVQNACPPDDAPPPRRAIPSPAGTIYTPATVCKGYGEFGFFGGYVATVRLNDLGTDVSNVLYIQGTGLKDAILYFENREVSRFDLRSADRRALALQLHFPVETFEMCASGFGLVGAAPE